MSELDALIGDYEEPAAETVEATPEPTPEPEQGVKQDVSEPPSEKPKEVEPDNWAKAAVLDERKKRQALEAELEALKRQQQPEAKKVDLFEDPEGYQKQVEQSIQKARIEDRISLSREIFASMKDDYEEAEAAFIDLAKQHPQLVGEMLVAPVPAKFAYEQGKKALAFNEMKAFDPDSYKAKLREELRSELMQELQSRQSQKQAKAANLTPSLAAIQTQTVKDDPEPSLEDLLGR